MSYLIELYGEPTNSFRTSFFGGLLFQTFFVYFGLRYYIENIFVSELPSKTYLQINQRKTEEKGKTDSSPAKKQFVTWLLCKCYKDEQKKRGFKWFVCLNYFYLALSAVFFVLGLVALFVPSFQYCFQVLLRMKAFHVDMIVFLASLVCAIVSNSKKHFSR